jgi:hypothetical protein
MSSRALLVDHQYELALVPQEDFDASWNASSMAVCDGLR